jgi:putative transposase
MTHSYTTLWTHLIFSTKDRAPIINDNFEIELYNHLNSKLINDLDCHVEEINGSNDHIHLLFTLSPNISLKDVVKNLKGESSHWVNSNNFVNLKFSWQTGYAAFSISIDKVSQVKKYILNQKEHHKKVSFIEEFGKLLKIYGFELKNR